MTPRDPKIARAIAVKVWLLFFAAIAAAILIGAVIGNYIFHTADRQTIESIIKPKYQ